MIMETTNKYDVGCVVAHTITGEAAVITRIEMCNATGIWQYELDNTWTAAEYELAWE
jgi:hypothetical protein